MRVSGDWLKDSGTQQILSLLNDAGFQAYVVGGCVRNAVLKQPVQDIDIATSARPDNIFSILSDAGLRVVPTGLEHGTITAVVDGRGYEVTTYRRDVKTDGRRAVVEFSDSLEEDARRRDFTINALYSDREGLVYDPIGGLSDLHARRIRFIGNPDKRIKEDYLRSLRFFRFQAWYGDPAGGMDPDALAAISANLPGLDTLSKERITSEVMRLLEAPKPVPAVEAMGRVGVLDRVLPGADHHLLSQLVGIEGKFGAKAIRRLAALGDADVEKRLRLSKRESRYLAVLKENIESDTPIEELAYRFGADVAVDVELLRAAASGRAPRENIQKIAREAEKKTFPVKAIDLMPTYSGPALGARLKELEDRWIRSGFTLTREELVGNL